MVVMRKTEKFMKLNVKKSFILILSILISIPSYASEKDCRSVLHDCDTAVKDLQTENALEAQIIKDEDARFATQTSELKTEQIWKPIAEGAIVAAILEGLILALKK